MDRDVSARSVNLQDSAIRRMSALCAQAGGVNLAQGFPDFPCPPELKDAAARALYDDHNQYAPTAGVPALRLKIAERYNARDPRWRVDPEEGICVTCGGTEAVFAAMAAVLDPGDEVIVPEPFYESYAPVARILGASVRFAPLRRADWGIDMQALADAFTPATRLLVLNSPHNPTGAVLSAAELDRVARLVAERGAFILSDEMYDRILFEGEVAPPGVHDAVRERTITVGGISKTYSVTGWRIGWTIAAPRLTTAIRRLHDLITCGAPAPLQHAAVTGLGLADEYHRGLASRYRQARDRLCAALEQAGFDFVRPAGGFFVMADFSAVAPRLDAAAFTEQLLAKHGIAAVPGPYFFADPARGESLARFAFCKSEPTIDEAVERLAGLARGGLG